jgi:hypothetical protein
MSKTIKKHPWCTPSHWGLSNDTNVTKKKGSEITQHTDCLQRPQASMFSWSTSQSSNLRSSSPTNCLLTLSNTHYKIKDVQVLYFHKTTEHISHHPSPGSPIHTNASKGNLSLQTIYIARKHKRDFHQLFTKHQIPSVV